MTILTTVRKLATISLAVIVVSPALAFVALAQTRKMTGDRPALARM